MNKNELKKIKEYNAVIISFSELVLKHCNWIDSCIDKNSLEVLSAIQLMRAVSIQNSKKIEEFHSYTEKIKNCVIGDVHQGYIAFDRNDVIWGVGITEKDALKDARTQTRAKLITLPCDDIMFKEISEQGYYHGNDAAYWYYDDVEELAKFIPIDPNNNGQIFKRFNVK